MPRRSGYRRRQSPTKRSQWAAASFSRQALAIGAIVHGNLTEPSATAGTEDRAWQTTLKRSIGRGNIVGGANNVESHGWHGLIKVRKENLVDAHMPDPNTDNYDWLFRAYWNLQMSDTNEANQGFNWEVDLKGMRKIRVNEDIVYIIEVDTGSAGSITWSSAFRLLLQS